MMKLQYETNRLCLKVLPTNEASKVLTFYLENQEHLRPYEPSKLPSFYTIAFQEKTLEYEYKQMLQMKHIRYYIFEKENMNRIIGCISISNIIRGAFLSCQLGYKIDHRHQKKGYATESISKCIDIIFSDYSLHRMEAMIMPSNSASIHLIEKLGFHYEGLSPSFAKINGEWEDHRRYSLINTL
ncbi:GNAT family N-acetyltransferase [Anaeromicropila herbilytica]|uniref:N-acetyltransferase domain-containing protein n=1 Tax=Anaeromicropila herbilytica TaxID=2785025 RepID=A0A7R7EHD6_9FIRM|nr:GNAT family N-acetyltransferase [Anaeromicropila herbilytica]BCN28745.1 hypothetical protein bsdtb5_00400 [Anaeromicropila herbilytica]